MDEDGVYQVEKLGYGDIWYFPKGVAHTIQGLKDENEYLLVFDEANFDAVGCVIVSLSRNRDWRGKCFFASVMAGDKD